MSELTEELLEQAAGISPALATRWLPHVLEAGRRFDFLGPRRLAMWLAQCGHESAGFARLEENLNYSADALVRTWPSRFPTLEDAAPYAHSPEKIANRVYSGRLGNGTEESGDGWRYRGRGLIQLTGRTNYRTCGAALGYDIVASPDELAAPRYAALSAGWFWSARGLNTPADEGDVDEVTRRINGGTIGLPDRRARYTRALEALEPVTT